MFSGKLANRRSGISKSGNQYYMISVFVDSSSGRRVQSDLFLDENVFKKVENVPYDSLITCISGINDYGRLYVKDINVGNK